MQTEKNLLSTVSIMLMLFMSACEGGSSKKDSNDTNTTPLIVEQTEVVNAIDDAPPISPSNCVTVTMPDKITYKHTTKYAFGKTIDMTVVQTNITKTNQYHEYMMNMAITTKEENGGTSGTIRMKEKFMEYYTISKDGVYIDTTKLIHEGLRITNLYDPKTAEWQAEVKHSVSNLHTSRTKDGTDSLNAENTVVGTYTPFKRRFADKYCKGQSFTTEHEDTYNVGGRVTSDKQKITYTVESIDEQKTVSAGTFTTIRLKHHNHLRGGDHTDWIDIKTGLAVSSKGANYTMELISYSVNALDMDHSQTKD
jgi:hypothetical protein